MITRRQFVATLGISLLTGCLSNAPNTCPSFPDTESTICDSSDSHVAQLDSNATSIHPDGKMKLSLTVQQPVTIRPTAHGIYTWRDGAWQGKRIVTGENDSEMRLLPEENYEWQLQFGARESYTRVDPSQNQTDISLVVHASDPTAIAIPIKSDDSSTTVANIISIK